MSDAKSGNEARSALYGALSDLPSTAPGAVVPCQETWIEVQMLDETEAPVPGLECEVIAPDGAPHRGVTDSNGVFRVEPVPPGQCTITFTSLDRRIWKKA
jgi:hypothetical protein